MTAGLPGVGIGGLFYLVSALLMPFRSCAAALAGRETRWLLALRQALIAAGTLAAVLATGWAIGWLIVTFPLTPVGGGALPDSMREAPVQNAVRTAMLLASLGTLTLVLALVQVLRLWLPPRPTPKAAGEASSSADNARSAA